MRTGVSPAVTIRIAAGETTRRWPSINEAYRVLGDPARRAVYDASLRPRPQ